MRPWNCPLIGLLLLGLLALSGCGNSAKVPAERSTATTTGATTATTTGVTANSTEPAKVAQDSSAKANNSSGKAHDAAKVTNAAWRLPEQLPHDGFLSSQACQRCHQKSHESWHRSFHRSMTQLASATSIQAPFDGRELARNGITCSVERRGDEFWVKAPDPDVVYQRARDKRPTSGSPAEMVERQVVLVTGSHHMQIYWLPSRHANELRIFPWVFFIDEQRWIPYEDSFVVPPTYGPMLANWNGNCIACHALDGKPNYDFQTTRFQTEVVEFGISCEACHGPGENHIRWHEDQRSLAEKGSDPILHPGNVPTKLAAEVCGQCHSDFIRDMDYYSSGPKYRAGGDLKAAQQTIDFETRKDPRHPFHDSHWEDGTARVGGREYQGMIASACFQKGELTCITCHSMHNADPNQQLATFALGNDVCLQCHQSIAQDIAAHTHHAIDSSGSECYNCHMPRTSIALFRAMRSHRIDSPSAATSQATGRPNACNLCHLGQSLAWTTEHLHNWYGVPPAELKSPSPAGRSMKTLPQMADLQFDFLAPDTDRQLARPCRDPIPIS